MQRVLYARRRQIGNFVGIERQTDDGKPCVRGIKAADDFFEERYAVFIRSRCGDAERIFGCNFVVFFRHKQKAHTRIAARYHIA